MKILTIYQQFGAGRYFTRFIGGASCIDARVSALNISNFQRTQPEHVLSETKQHNTNNY